MGTGCSRTIVWLVLAFFCSNISAQDSSTIKSLRKPELLSSGFLDIATNGQVNASARLIRIYLGEPGKFNIPLSIYSGVSSGNFSPASPVQMPMSNEHLVSSFINPLTGIINVSAEGVLGNRKEQQRPTACGFIYQGGGRILTGYRTGSVPGINAIRPVNFFNGYALMGVYFQTGAWERSEEENMGLFWISARYIASCSSPGILSQIIAQPVSGLYHGWSIGGGIDISSLVNLRVVYYKYVKSPETGFSNSLCQFSFNYALRN